MQSTLQRSLDQLQMFGIDVDPDNCDTAAMRLDAEDIREGITPLHMESCPPRFAADLLHTVASILDGQMD